MKKLHSTDSEFDRTYFLASIRSETCVAQRTDRRHHHHFCRAMLCIRAAYAVIQCLCVCLSVTFVDCVKTNNHSINIFFTIGQPHHSILFSCQTAQQYSDGNPHNWWDIGINRDSEPISGLTACVNNLTYTSLFNEQARCCKHGRRLTTATVSQVMTHRW